MSEMEWGRAVFKLRLSSYENEQLAYARSRLD